MPSDAPTSRNRVTSHAELAHVALRLFLDRGFDATTIDDIAHAAGIGRRTMFRYYPSKNDLAWGDFEPLLAQMRARLDAAPDDVGTMQAIRDAVIEFNRYPDAELPYLRARMRLLLETPALVGHSTLRYESWRRIIAEFVARRTGADPADLQPDAVSWAFLAAVLSAYTHWLAHEEDDLLDTIRAALDQLRVAFTDG